MSFQTKITDKLSRASLDYLRIGLDKFHKYSQSINWNHQSAIGNICIATELVLKAVISKRTFPLLYSNLPIDIQVKLYVDQSLDKLGFSPFDIQSFENSLFKTIEIDKCVGIFYALHPESKQEFKQFFGKIFEVRNTSLHSVTPDFQKYTLEWIAYHLLSLILFLRKEEYAFLTYFRLTEEDEKFYKSFDIERNLKVQKIVKNAREKAKNLSPTLRRLIEKDYDLYVIKCPICSSENFLKGYTDFDSFEGEDGLDICLNFYGESFSCEDCGLLLSGTDELALVGIGTIYDRSEDSEDWFEEYINNFQADRYR